MAAEIFIFSLLRSSSIRSHLPLKFVFIETYFSLVWSHEHMFKIWGRSDQWLLRYSTFYILRSSSIRGRLPLKVVFIETFFSFWFGPMSSCLKFEEDPISGCWDIQSSIFWGQLPLEVVFIWRSSLFECRLHWNLFWLWFGPMSLWLKSKEDPVSDCKDSQCFINWGHLPLRGCLPLKVVFIENLLDFG